jgi:two-component system sensor histidine kinase QseC
LNSRHTKATSLRLQLLATISFSLLLVWCAVAWFAYDKGLHEAEELMDGQLALSARLLDGQINHEESTHPDSWFSELGPKADHTIPALIENLDPEGRLPYEQELAFQIWHSSGILTLLSDNAKNMQLIAQPGYSDQVFNDLTWRTYTKKSRDANYLIQVAHPVTTRDLIGLDVAWRVTIPLFFAFPFLLLMMYWAVTRSLKPLNTIAANLSRRTSEELDPVSVIGVPKEIFPIVHSFNTLLKRVAVSVANERRFTSNAAHELRTPLAGIKLYAQLAEAATDDASREKFLTQVLKGIVRADRLVSQMLSLARLDPENYALIDAKEQVDVKTLFLEAQDIEALHIREKNQSVVLNIAQDAQRIEGIENLLLIAVSNLIGNASRYAPEGTVITLGSWRDARTFGLYVQDQGAGIPQDELPDITQRFKRGSEVSAPGCGLGLAIVERIAAIHQIRLLLTNHSTGGLRASLSWDV